MSQYRQKQPTRLDELFRSLADQRRRAVLECLAEESTPVVLEALVEQIREREGDTGGEEIAVTLLHNHFPRLEEAGLIEIDHEMKAVQEGDRFETAMQVLEVKKFVGG